MSDERKLDRLLNRPRVVVVKQDGVFFVELLDVPEYEVTCGHSHKQLHAAKACAKRVLRRWTDRIGIHNPVREMSRRELSEARKAKSA